MGATPLILATKATSWVVRADEGHSCHVFPVIAAQLIAMFSSAVGNRAPPVFFRSHCRSAREKLWSWRQGDQTARRGGRVLPLAQGSRHKWVWQKCFGAQLIFVESCWHGGTTDVPWIHGFLGASSYYIILCLFMRKENTDQSTCLTPAVLPQPQHILQWWLTGTQIEAGTTIQHSFFIFFWMVLVGHQIKSASFPRVAKYRLYRLYNYIIYI